MAWKSLKTLIQENIASETELGVVKVGTGLTTTADGTLNVDTATTDSPGNVIVGDQLLVDDEGRISAAVVTYGTGDPNDASNDATSPIYIDNSIADSNLAAGLYFRIKV